MMCSVTVIDDNRGVPQENLLPATQFPEKRGRGRGEEEGRGTERERDPRKKNLPRMNYFFTLPYSSSSTFSSRLGRVHLVKH